LTSVLTSCKLISEMREEKRIKQVPIKNDTYYPGQRNEKWTEPFVRSEIIREETSVYHLSDFPVESFKKQVICCFYFQPTLQTNIYNQLERIYEVVIPKNTEINFYGDGNEVRINLRENPDIKIYEIILL